MCNPSPYDLSAIGRDRIKKQIERTNRSRSKETNSFRSPFRSSPYDLSSHDGLAGLAEKAREDPIRF